VPEPACRRPVHRAQGAAEPAPLAALQAGGLPAAGEPGYAHSLGKLPAIQISQLQEYLRQDLGSTLADAQRYVRQEFGVGYTVSCLCRLFQRLRIKLKTGRPVNIRRDEGRAEAFKKTSRS
jgi:transposase